MATKIALCYFLGFCQPVATTSKRKKEEEDDGPSVIHKIGKDQRIKDEKSLKVTI